MIVSKKCCKKYKKKGKNMCKNCPKACFDLLNTQRELIYESENFALYQSDLTNKFYFEYFETERELPLCALMMMKQKVENINIESLLDSDSVTDFEIIRFGCLDKTSVLNYHEIAELKSFFADAFGMLYLNRSIQRDLQVELEVL